jgi:hypothetical protein
VYCVLCLLSMILWQQINSHVTLPLTRHHCTVQYIFMRIGRGIVRMVAREMVLRRAEYLSQVDI